MRIWILKHCEMLVWFEGFEDRIDVGGIRFCFYRFERGNFKPNKRWGIGIQCSDVECEVHVCYSLSNSTNQEGEMIPDNIPMQNVCSWNNAWKSETKLEQCLKDWNEIGIMFVLLNLMGAAQCTKWLYHLFPLNSNGWFSRQYAVVFLDVSLEENISEAEHVTSFC